ncbi:ROK family protein [Ruania alkalisoli]|uniref:ROK family protein n=1 Tax=Ruania alkalisoli TaxID=2779775 RepID=A0A7M1ST24_9MICO|nr:ROK family protein [Ruania alkalisoli]QOR70718.1 ROK family protein [Ruania alkalisoli]
MPMTPRVVVAVDIGGTKTAAATVTRDAQVGPIQHVPTPAAAGPEAVIASVADLIRSVLEQASDDDGTVPPLLGIGVATAGMVDTRTGTIVAANSTFPGWPGTAVGKRLSGLFETKVRVQHDVAAHGAGEAWAGAGRGATCALMVAVGTGVGSAIVLEGRSRGGAHHAAGEMGHMPSRLAASMPCPCGRTGHLEAIASGPAIASRYQAIRGGDAQTPVVLARADAGEPDAVSVVRDAATALGEAIAGSVTVLDPEVVILGGGIARASQTWLTTLRQSVHHELVAPLREIPLRLSELEGAAPLLGAARAVWQADDDMPAGGRW